LSILFLLYVHMRLLSCTLVFVFAPLETVFQSESHFHFICVRIDQLAVKVFAVL